MWKVGGSCAVKVGHGVIIRAGLCTQLWAGQEKVGQPGTGLEPLRVIKGNEPWHTLAQAHAQVTG